MYLRLTLFWLFLYTAISAYSILLQTVSHNAGGLQNINNVAHHLVELLKISAENTPNFMASLKRCAAKKIHCSTA
jgi:hypothetical protein